MFGFSVRAKVGILEWIRPEAMVVVRRMDGGAPTTDWRCA